MLDPPLISKLKLETPEVIVRNKKIKYTPKVKLLQNDRFSLSVYDNSFHGDLIAQVPIPDPEETISRKPEIANPQGKITEVVQEK